LSEVGEGEEEWLGEEVIVVDPWDVTQKVAQFLMWTERTGWQFLTKPGESIGGIFESSGKFRIFRRQETSWGRITYKVNAIWKCEKEDGVMTKERSKTKWEEGQTIYHRYLHKFCPPPDKFDHQFRFSIESQNGDPLDDPYLSNEITPAERTANVIPLTPLCNKSFWKPPKSTYGMNLYFSIR
jgi:hypothetical protein